MNNFEKKISNEYIKNHSLSLMQEADQLANEFRDVIDPQLLREHEMSVSAMHRFVYLALKEYHNSLSRNLAEHEIPLPDFDTLVADQFSHRD